MCYWVGTKNVREALAKRVGNSGGEEIKQLFYADLFRNGLMPEIADHWVAIGKSKPILTTLRIARDNLQTCEMQWTMPLTYTDNRSGQKVHYNMLNIMVENILTTHKQHLARRCVVPIDGYFEFYHKGREVFPYFIAPSDDGVFFVGALWCSNTDAQSGQEQPCMALITTPPNNLTRHLHNNPKAPHGPRMLLLMDEKQAANFLSTDPNPVSINQLLEPCPDEKLKSWPVARFLTKEFNTLIDTAKVREPVVYPQLSAAHSAGQLLF